MSSRREVDFLPMIGGALAGIPTVLFAFIAGGPTAGIVTAVVFAVYTQIENHVLNPVVMSKTVRISPLLAIPTAGALQVLVKEIWQATAPDQPGKPRRPRLSQQTSVPTERGGSSAKQLCTRHRAG